MYVYWLSGMQQPWRLMYSFCHSMHVLAASDLMGSLTSWCEHEFRWLLDFRLRFSGSARPLLCHVLAFRSSDPFTPCTSAHASSHTPRSATWKR